MIIMITITLMKTIFMVMISETTRTMMIIMIMMTMKMTVLTTMIMTMNTAMIMTLVTLVVKAGKITLDLSNLIQHQRR